MSLVNDMLRDLNRRTPVSNQAARVHGAIHASIESKRPKAKIGLIVAGCLLAGLGAGYFYFETMGVQVVQVPLAVVPRQQPAQPEPVSVAPEVPAPSTPAATAQVALASDPAANLPAVENVAEIRELALQPNGFTIIVETSEATTFDVRDRTAFGLTLHLDGIDRFDRAGTTAPGMSLLLVSDGLDIGIELEEAADFLVREDSETAAFDILITASYRPAEALSGLETPAPQVEVITQGEPEVTPESIASTSVPPPQSGAAPVARERSTPVRIDREQSFEAKDRNNSQTALMMVQGGQTIEAFRQLLTFLEENPLAQQSRETLAKLLLAQRDYAQAGAVIDEGLAQSPENASFKKIKARLLMQANDATQAVSVLRSAPPSAASDTEYYELLASAYQQGGSHQQAVATYQELLRVDRTQGRWWAAMGIALEAQDMPVDALTSYRAALQTTNLETSLRQYVQRRISSLGNEQ